MHNLVLIIDDSLTTRAILKVCLHRAGMDCLLFADGRQALAALRDQPDLVPAVVFLDIGLPGMDGYHVAQALRRKAQLTQTAIVMLSGRDGVLDRLKARLAGANHYLAKPFTRQTILALISPYIAHVPLKHASEGREGETYAISGT